MRNREKWNKGWEEFTLFIQFWTLEAAQVLAYGRDVLFHVRTELRRSVYVQ